MSNTTVPCNFSENEPPIQIHVGDEEALLERLCNCAGRTKGPSSRMVRPFVFLVGAALSCPESDGGKGVPGAEEMVTMIQKELGTGKLLAGASYQDAWAALSLLQGPEGARKVLQGAIKRAWNDRSKKWPESGDEREFEIMEGRLTDWHIPAGTRALGTIIAEFPDRFGKYLLTTNFDPLLAVSIRLAGGRAVQTALHGDGNPRQTLVPGCHLIHLHGYWYRDALHTPIQLTHERQQLFEFLKEIIRNFTVVVMGYGGWKDLFTKAVEDVIKEQNAEPDILWSLYRGYQEYVSEGEKRNDFCKLAMRLGSGVARGRVSFFTGINCNTFLPKMLKKLRLAQTPLLDENRKKEILEPTNNGSLDEAVKMVTNGLWIFLSAHGTRWVAALKDSGAEGAYEDRREGEVGSLDLARLFGYGGTKRDFYEHWVLRREENGEWSLTLSRNRESSKGAQGKERSLRIPSVLCGPIFCCYEEDAGQVGEGTNDWFKEWLRKWKNTWLKSLNNPNPSGDARCKDYAAYYLENILLFDKCTNQDSEVWDPEVIRGLPQPHAQESHPAPIVAIHVPADPPLNFKAKPDDPFDKKWLCQGYWIKLANFGGSYVVKLDECGGLTEYRVFDRALQWHGRWWVGDPCDKVGSGQAKSEDQGKDKEKYLRGKALNIWLGTWALPVGFSFSLEDGIKKKIQEELNEVLGDPEQMKACFYGPFTEINKGEDLHSNDFFVAHAFLI